MMVEERDEALRLRGSTESRYIDHMLTCKNRSPINKGARRPHVPALPLSMKAFLLLCAILVIIMNTVKCPGCQKQFNHGKAIKAHQRTCAGLHLVAREQFKKRGENDQKREAAKLARLDGQTMENVAEERQELRNDLEDGIVLDHSPVIGESSMVRICGYKISALI
jgi:hypothetical protein